MKMPKPESLKRKRHGLEVLEMATVMPVVMLLIFGFMEMAQMGMSYQLVTNAAFQGCRVAVINGYTQSDVITTAGNILSGGGIKSGNFTLVTNPANVTTSHLGDQVTVTISVPFRQVSWLAPMLLGSTTLKSSATLSSERP